MVRLVTLYRNSFANIQTNIWVLSIAMFINRSGSMVLLFTSLYLTKELHFSISEAGVVLSFYGVGSVLGAYYGGWLTDRKNYFDVMLLSFIASGLLLFLMLVASTPITVSAVIFIYAFFADMFRPANAKAISIYSDPGNLTRSVSLVRLAMNVGFSIGPAAGGFIAMYLGYKWLFVVDGITSLLTALMLYVYLPKQAEENSQTAAETPTVKSRSAYRDMTYLIFIFLVAAFATCFFQLFASVPQYFSTVSHYNEDVIGLLLALNGFLVVVIEMPLISFLEQKKKIFPFIIAGVLCIPAAFTILRFGNGLIFWAIIYTVVITFAEIFAMPFMMNYSITRPHKTRQGQYSALYSISYGIANTAAPVVGLGVAGKFGFNAMFYILISAGLLTAGGFYLLKLRDDRERAAGSPNLREEITPPH